MDKEDIEWLITLIVTTWLALRNNKKPKEKPSNRKPRKKQKR